MEHEADYEFEPEFPCPKCPVFAICFNSDNLEVLVSCSRLKSYLLEDLISRKIVILTVGFTIQRIQNS